MSGVDKGDQVRNLLTRFDGVRVTDLEVTAADEQVRSRAEEQRQVTVLTFPSPASGELTYEVSYRVETTGDATELPLAVPAYSAGEERVVELSYRIPDGYHLQGSPFPVGIGETGTQRRDLLGVPTFLDYRLGTTPPGPVTPFNVLGGAVVVLVVALSVLVIVREARRNRREAHA